MENCALSVTLPGAAERFRFRGIAEKYDLAEPDGVYDAKTQQAVKSFQESHKIKATGSVNDATWKAIFDEPFYLWYSLGLSARSLRYQCRLVPPFTSAEVVDNKNGYDHTAKLTVDAFTCYVQLVSAESMEALVKEEKDYARKSYDETFVPQYGGKNFKVSGEKKYKINGKPAQIWNTTWTFTNEEKLDHYIFYGTVELDKVDGVQMYAVVYMNYNIPASAKAITKLVGTNAVKDVLNGIRCGRDRLAEYEAGAAKRKKASKIKGKFTLPEFQPVDDYQSTLDIIYEIREYVDPSADGSAEKIDGKTCVSLYYGYKIMQYYKNMVDAGNKASDAMMESVMSLANGVFDKGLREDFPALREQVSASLKAAQLALTKDAAPYLVLLGLDSPRWTAEELNEMQDRLISSMDAVINK